MLAKNSIHKKKDVIMKYLDDNLRLIEERILVDNYEINENMGFLILYNIKIIDPKIDKYVFEDRYIKLNRLREFTIRYED